MPEQTPTPEQVPAPEQAPTPEPLARYEHRLLAAGYDVLSGEWPVYRAGRREGVAQLDLRPGMRVLDLGCGTGLSLGMLRRAVGPTGEVVGLDVSGRMLARAAGRVGRRGWRGVRLVRADAAGADRAGLLAGGRPYDAVLAVYSLSLMPRWRAVLDAAAGALARTGRCCVVDMAVPTGGAAVLAPLARAACTAGGADITAHPWTALEDPAGPWLELRRAGLRGGHVQVRTARLA